jgi:hypothetical protein
MPKRFASRIGGNAIPYRIVIGGPLPQPLVGPLEGMRVETESDDQSVLVGEIVDQSQLQGILGWLSHVGVEIVSVNPLEEDDRAV